jgi:hypothetical protein
VPDDRPKVDVEVVLVEAVGSGDNGHGGLLICSRALGCSSVPAQLVVDDSAPVADDSSGRADRGEERGRTGRQPGSKDWTGALNEHESAPRCAVGNFGLIR